MAASHERSNGSALRSAIDNERPSQSLPIWTPNISVSFTDEPDPMDPVPPASPPQKQLTRSKSLASMNGSAKEESPPSPKTARIPDWNRLSLRIPDSVRVPTSASRRTTERKKSKVDRDAQLSQPEHPPRFQHIIPDIRPRKFWEPKIEDNRCPIDVVVVYMCGNHVNSDDWDLSVFLEKKDKRDKMAIGESPSRVKEATGLLNIPMEESGRGQSKRPQVKRSKSQSSGVMSWLEDPDLLPKALPAARILGFGLDINGCVSNNAPIDLRDAASKILSQLLKDRDQHSQDPVVFIGHGYGNVVIHQMLFEDLLDTVKEEQRTHLVESTAVVTMFAPPLKNFDGLVNWAARTFDVSKKSTRLFEARKDNSHIPEVMWPRFFDSAEEHKIITLAYLDESQGFRPAKNPEQPLQKSPNRFDRSWLCEWDIENVARFSSPQDSRFRNISKAISESLGFRQLLSAGQALDDTSMADLIKASDNLNFENGRRQTTLHVAAQQGLTKLVQRLVNSGKVDLDRQDDSGNTTLHIAVDPEYPSDPDMVFCLLEAGAKLGVKNKHDKSAQDIALNDAAVIQRIKELIARPPLVKGPSGPRRLVRGRPANEKAQAACRSADMTVREIFPAEGDKPDTHLPVYKSIQDLIYTDENISNWFQSARDKKSSKPLCQWYHVPMNNMAWIHDLFAKLGLPHWPWPKPHKRSKIFHGRYMSPEATRLPGLQRTSANSSNDNWVLFMPYISYESSIRQRYLAEIANRIGPSPPKMFLLPNLPFSRPRLKVPRRSTNDTRMFLSPDRDYEALAIKGYLKDQNHNENQHLTLHPRRTLDQSYYYMLKDTSYRDRTQVVSRWAKSEWPDQDDHNILMVDQLWMWFVKGQGDQPDTIITSFPARKGAIFPQSSREADDLESIVLNDDDRAPISESADLVSRILSVCCNAFDRHQHLDPINFLQFFESAIGRAEEEETRLFRRFRRRAKMLHALHEMHRTYSRHRSMLLKKLLDILKESKLLKEIKDILDEIKMIKSVVKDQLKVVTALQKIVAGKRVTVRPSISSSSIFESDDKFAEVLDLLGETQASFDLMESHAKEVEKGIEHLLDLKQKQANLWEARSSREGAEQAARQGSTIMVFTVVTIIFLPLSFMASFFALGISIFPKTEGENNFPIGWVSALLFGISFAFSIPFILLAFNIEKFSIAWTRIKHTANKLTAFLFLKPLRESRRIQSKRVRDTGSKWYKEWVSFIAKHDLPFKPDEEMDKRLKAEMEGRKMTADPPNPEWIYYSDSSSGEEETDDEEYNLVMRQRRRQSDLLTWMKG